MLNIREIVNFTTLSESTIDRMIERGELAAGVKIGERRVAWRWGNVRQKVFKLVDEARKRERSTTATSVSLSLSTILKCTTKRPWSPGRLRRRPALPAVVSLPTSRW